MPKALKSKALATPAAQNRQEAESLVLRIGELQRELTRREADLGDSLARIKKAAEDASLPLALELLGAHAAVQTWAEANRAVITKDGRTKTVKLATGLIAWRNRPPKVSLRGVDAILEFLLGDKKLKRFLRVKHEIDKEALGKEPDEARKVPGVSVGSAGEDFIIEPFEAQLAEVRA